MIGSRWKKIFSDFWGNKSRAFLTVIIIMVGTFAVGFTSNMGSYLSDSMNMDYLSANPSEATISAYPLNDDMVEIARSIPGVDSAEAYSALNARILRPDGSYVTIGFTALKDPNERELNLLKPIGLESGDVQTYGNHEMLVDSSAMGLGYNPGDMVTIELDDGKRREVKIAGYMHDVTAYPFNLAEFVTAYVTPETMVWLGGERTSNVMAISVTEKQTDQEHVTEVAQVVADRLERAGATVYFVNVYRPGRHFAYEIAQGMFFILGILGYMTVFLSSFLIINTITAIMTQQTRQIGIMKATGGSSWQIFGMYIVLILAFGIFGFLLAVPLANNVAYTIGSGMAQWMNVNPAPYLGYTSTVIQQFIVAVIVPVFAALFPIYNAVKVTVREAISDYGLGGNASPKADTVNKNSILIPRPIRISLRNTFRRKARLALTLFTLVLGGAIFISVYNLWESLDKAILDIQGYFLADINVGFSRFYRLEKVETLAMNIPEVESVEGWLEYPGTLKTSEEDKGTQIMFVAPPSNSRLIDPVISSGRWLQPGDENAIVIGNHLLQMFPDLKVGDWLTIEVNGAETRWLIIGTYVITGNISPPLLYVNYEYISGIMHLPGQVYALRVITKGHDMQTQKRVEEQLKAIYAAKAVRVSSTQLGTEFIENQSATTDILVYFLLVMASLIAVVGGLGLTGTMSINVLERTREIGVMRAIGADNGDIQSIVITEGMVIGIISWAISILVSFPFTNILCYGLGVALLTAPLSPLHGVTGIIAWLIFTIILSSVASAIPARHASGLTVRDALAYE